MRRTSAAIAVLLVLVSGCAGESGSRPASPDDVRPEFEAATDRIAEAWRAAPASGAWRTGYVPLQPSTVLPSDPGFDDDTKQAFLAGWYREKIPLPTAKPAYGTIRFPDGTLTVPLISAAEAYRQLDQGEPPPCPGRPATRQPPVPTATGPDTATSTTVDSCVALTVTAAKLGTVSVRTSRGGARVPAWLFTIDELSGPIARVAVAESAVAPVPTAAIPEPTDSPPPPDLVTAQDILEVDGARLTYRLGVGACDTQITPLVAEYPDVVVVAGRVVRSSGICTEQLLLAPVTVTLGAPLGARPVLTLDGLGPLRLTVS